MNKQEILEMTILFHDTYEKLAPKYGYETRKDTKEFNPNTPNGMLMIEVVGIVCKAIEEKIDWCKHHSHDVSEFYEPKESDSEITRRFMEIHNPKTFNF